MAIYVTEKISYGLGWITTYRITPEINPFPIMLNIQSKLTLGDQVSIPYFRRLKKIPFEISIKLVPTHFPQQQKYIQA